MGPSIALWIAGAVVVVLIVWGGWSAVRVVMTLSWAQWRYVLLCAGATFLRTSIALLVAAAWTVPAGVAIGLNPRLARRMQPLVQIAASVPATAIFPVLLLALLALPGGLNMAAVALMLLGTQWYVLFNVIAGAMAIPSEGRRRRKRGTLNGSKRGLGKDKVPVLVARARSGDTRSIVLPGTSSASALTAVLRDVLAPGVTLCTDGSKALRSTAQALGVKHVALVTARRQRKRAIYHVQTVNSYQGRLKGWMRRFRGGATKYLARYLGWHVLHERVQRVSAMKARSVLLGNTAELAAHRCCPDCGAVLSAA